MNPKLIANQQNPIHRRPYTNAAVSGMTAPHKSMNTPIKKKMIERSFLTKGNIILFSLWTGGNFIINCIYVTTHKDILLLKEGKRIQEQAEEEIKINADPACGGFTFEKDSYNKRLEGIARQVIAQGKTFKIVVPETAVISVWLKLEIYDSIRADHTTSKVDLQTFIEIQLGINPEMIEKV